MSMIISKRYIWLTEIIKHLSLFQQPEWVMGNGSGELRVGLFFVFCFHCRRLQEDIFSFYFGKGIIVAKFEVVQPESSAG